MRPSLALAALPVIAALSSGCAHTLESSRDDRVVVAVDGQSSLSRTEVTEAPPVFVAEPAPPPRARLSRTVTLGEGSSEPVYVGAAQPAPVTGQNGGNVIVNNNITVVGSPPVVYGGYGGYGYSGGGSGVGYGMREGYSRGTGSRSAWAPSGWEGAGRTAAPGTTPHVGGNWAPPPSHGPRQFK